KMNENILHKGATFLDPDYFFNLTDFTIPETESGCLQNVATTCYADGRIAYIYGNNPHYASNPADYVNDKVIQSFQIDLYNKMIKLLPLPRTNTYSNFINKMGDFIWIDYHVRRCSLVFL
ncbi:hypothetical protein EZS27_041868, partial [termite gut metagenome]